MYIQIIQKIKLCTYNIKYMKEHNPQNIQTLYTTRAKHVKFQTFSRTPMMIFSISSSKKQLVYTLTSKLLNIHANILNFHITPYQFTIIQHNKKKKRVKEKLGKNKNIQIDPCSSIKCHGWRGRGTFIRHIFSLIYKSFQVKID